MTPRPDAASSPPPPKRAVHRREFLATGATLLATASSLVPREAAGTVRAKAEPDGDLRIQRLTWAGLKIEYGTTTVLIDPLADPDFLGGELTELVPIEITTKHCYVLVTHGHNDHYDPLAARAHLSERGAVICHQSLAPTIAADGLRVNGVELNETTVLPRGGGELAVTPVDAVDGLGARQVSWVVSGAGRRIIHCGDTLWHGYWWRLGRQYGPFDLAFLPINGAIVGWPVPPSGLPASLTPEQASAAAQILGAKMLCPIHYGGNEPPSYVEFPDAIRAVTAAAKARGVPLQVAKPGAMVTLPPRQ